MKHRLMYILGIISLILSSFILLLMFFWSIYPYKPIVINKEPIKVITKEVKKGDILIYELDYCKNNKNKVEISRSFVDGIVFATPTVTTENPLGCTVSNISIQVPETLPNGEYYLKVSYSYQVNPIRKVSVDSTTETFTVK